MKRKVQWEAGKLGYNRKGVMLQYFIGNKNDINVENGAACHTLLILPLFS